MQSDGRPARLSDVYLSSMRAISMQTRLFFNITSLLYTDGRTIRQQDGRVCSHIGSTSPDETGGEKFFKKKVLEE